MVGSGQLPDGDAPGGRAGIVIDAAVPAEELAAAASRASAVTECSAGRWTVAVVSCSTDAAWDLPGMLDGLDVVEVCRPFTRFGEIAMLVAKGLHKPICASDLSIRTSELGASYRILDLADAVIVPPAPGEDRPATSAEVRTFRPGHEADDRAALYTELARP